MSRLYVMNDQRPAGVFPVRDAEEARRWNEQGFGVFVSLNSFRGARRIENLTRINAWAVDIDTGTKAEQRVRINDCPLVPSRIVETKRGYQLWWLAKDARPEHWNAIVLDRLVYQFGADKNARDMARILRMPGYYHCKDPSDRFLVTLKHSHPVSYTELEMITWFTAAPRREERTERATPPSAMPSVSSTDRLRRYCQRALDLAAQEIEQTPHGERHGAILNTAVALGGYVHSGGLAEHEIIATLTAAMHRTWSKDPIDRKNHAKTLRDGIRYGMARPRSIILREAR